MKIEESPETNNHHIIKKVIANGNGEVVNGKCGSPKVKTCNDFESATNKSDDSPLTNGKGKHVNSEENLNYNNNINNNNNHINGNATEIKNGDGAVSNGTTSSTTTSSPTKNGVTEEKTTTSTKTKSKDVNANKSKGNLAEISKLADKLNRQKIGKSLVNGEDSKMKKSACNGANTSEKHEEHVAITNGSSSSNNENLNTNGKPVNNKKKQKNVNDIESQNGQTSITNGNGNCETDHVVNQPPINGDLPEKDVSIITKEETRVIKGKVTPVTKSGDNVECEPRVDEKGISQVSTSSHNGESERSDSPASSATLSSLSASSSNNLNGELVMNGDHDGENVEAENENQNNSNKDNTKCTENPCAPEVKADYDVLEGPFFGQLNGHSAEDPVIIYQFELAQYLCGRLIGRNGHYVNQIKEKSNASVVVNRHPLTPLFKICSIEGNRSEIRRALRLIRARFPIYSFPEVTLQQINVISPLLQACQVTVPQSCQLHLPEGVSCDVILSNVVNAGHIFVRQPTHPTYPSLSRLDQFMNATYSVETPPVLAPNPGDICAVNMCSGWYRAMVVNVWDDSDVEVKFVDYGGYSRAPISSLRQIRYDFMTLPFQASECYLANVKPIDEDQGWSKEANVVFHDLAQGQMLQAKIVAYADDGIPLIHLHKIQGASNIFINQELVNRGLGQWVEHQMWE